MDNFNFLEELTSTPLLSHFLLIFPYVGYDTEAFSEDHLKQIYQQLKTENDNSVYESNFDIFFSIYEEEYKNYSRFIQPELFSFVVHDCTHSLRVLFWVLVLCRDLRIKDTQKKQLIHATLFHDIGRVHDMEDKWHGKRAVTLLEKNKQNPLNLSNEDLQIANQIIYYHSIDDNEILVDFDILSLIRLFKDADALDRVRIMDLDINYLRYQESKKYILYVKKLYERI